jgi:hypothetical protein
MRALARILLICLVAVAAASPIRAQAPAAKPLTNADVIKLVQAGLSEDLVIASIEQAARKSFDLSADGLISLKQAGVPESVIGVMLGRPAASGPAAGPAPRDDAPAPPSPRPGGTPSAAQVPDQPPGIYLEQDGKLVPLEPTVVAGIKDGGAGIFTRLIPRTKAAQIRGTRANLRVTKEPATFYFFFGQPSGDAFASSVTGSFVGTLASASSPNEFVLMQMYVQTKNGVREMDIGKQFMFTDRVGVDSENAVPLAAERLAPGRYKVTPDERLGKGEFCFFYAAGAANMAGGILMPATFPKLFDFGVD